MAKEIVPLQPEWVPELADFLREGFRAPADASFAAAEALHWKYFDPDGSGLTTRSLVAREGGKIIGHIGFCPATLVTGSSKKQLTSMHMMDWLTPARHSPMGATLMLQAFRQAETQFAVGGLEGGRQVSARAGYREMGQVATYLRVLNPSFSLRLPPSVQAWKRPLRLARDYLRVLMNRPETPRVSMSVNRTDRFGDEVEMAVNASTMPEVHTKRTADRLNHHLRHPRKQVSGWLLSDSEKVRGFALLNLLPRGSIRFGKIVDLFLDRPDANLYQAALHLLTVELENRGADLVECYATTRWLVLALERNGFFRHRLQNFDLRDPGQEIAAESAVYLTQLEADHGYL